MKAKHTKALLAAALMLALLTGCGPGPAPVPAPTEPPPATAPPTTVTPRPEATQPEPPKGPVQWLDTGSLARSGLSIQQIFVCDEETILLFVSPINGDGTISESMLVYSYSFALGGLCPASFTAGVVSLYPTGVLEDGRVTLVTLDSESYAPESLVFLDTVTLEAVRAPLPQDDFYDLHISPNGQYAAITTYDYLRVTDPGYQTEYWRIDRAEIPLPPEGEGEEVFLDEHLPLATGWTADSSRLCYKVVSWAEDCAPGLIDTAGWTAATVPQLAGCALTPIGGGLYTYSSIYGDLPAGLYRETGQLFPLWDGILAQNEVLTAVVGHPSGAVCLLTLEADTGVGTVYVADALESTLVGTLGGAEAGMVFEQAAFLPGGSGLCLLARPVGGGARQVLIWDYSEG